MVGLSQEIRFDGATLRKLRKQRGWTQEQLAQLSGISVSHVSQLEKGTRKSPSIDMVYQLAQALSVSVYALLRLDTEELSSASASSFTTGSGIPLTAEATERWSQWQAWERTLRPDLARFIFTDTSQVYLSFAKDLHDARRSSTRVLQLVNDFLSGLDDDPLPAPDNSERNPS